MNKEINNLIENFDQLSIEELENYEILINTGGGPTPAPGSTSNNPKLEFSELEEGYAPMPHRPYMQYYDRIIP